MREKAFRVEVFGYELLVEYKVYPTSRDLRRALKRAYPEHSWTGERGCCGWEPPIVTLSLSEEEICAYYVVHELNHAVDYATPLSAYRAMAEGELHDGVDPMDVRAWLIGELVQEFWGWCDV